MSKHHRHKCSKRDKDIMEKLIDACCCGKEKKEYSCSCSSFCSEKKRRHRNYCD